MNEKAIEILVGVGKEILESMRNSDIDEAINSMTDAMDSILDGIVKLIQG